MKIAICISGHVRNFQRYSKEFFEKVISPNSHHEIDIFISTWDKNNSKSSFASSRRGYQDDSDLDVIGMLNTYNPKMYIVERNNDDIFENFNIDGHSNNPKFVVPQFYKINQVGNLLKYYIQSNNIKYDLVMKTRFDLVYDVTEDFDFTDSNATSTPKNIQFDEIDTNYFNIEHDCNQYPEWVHDKIFISNPENYFKYIEIYNNVEDLISSTSVYTTEQLTFHWLESQNIPVKKDFSIKGIAITGWFLKTD